jgi:hypothetical protein
MPVRHWDISGRRWHDLSLTLHCPLRHGQLLEVLVARHVALEAGLQAAVATAACRGPSSSAAGGSCDSSMDMGGEQGGGGPGQGRGQEQPRQLGSLDLSGCLLPEATRAACTPPPRSALGSSSSSSSSSSGSSGSSSSSRTSPQPKARPSAGSEQGSGSAAAAAQLRSASPSGLLGMLAAGARELGDLRLAGLELSGCCSGADGRLPAALQLVQRLDLDGAEGVGTRHLQQLLCSCSSLTALRLAGCKGLAAERGEEGVAAAIHAAQQQLEQRRAAHLGLQAAAQQQQGSLLPHLHELAVGWGWGDRSLRLMASSLQLLVRLDVGVGASLTDSGLGLLASACQHLQQVSLALCAVSDAGGSLLLPYAGCTPA